MTRNASDWEAAHGPVLLAAFFLRERVGSFLGRTELVRNTRGVSNEKSREPSGQPVAAYAQGASATGKPLARQNCAAVLPNAATGIVSRPCLSSTSFALFSMIAK